MYKGDLKNVPSEVVVVILERQLEQGNRRDVSVFEETLYAQQDENGFDWDAAPEGDNFWERVLEFEEWEIFFEKYPRKSCGDYKEGDYIIVTELHGESNYYNWFMPNEVIKVGGDRWMGSLREHFAAISANNYPNGNGMNYNFEENYKIRHATDWEILLSFWGSFPKTKIELQVGDTYENSTGKMMRIHSMNNSMLWYIHENGTLYEEEKNTILERLERKLYKNYKSVNNKSKTIKNEVHRENSESRRTSNKGIRAIRQKVEIASASRPVGSRVSDIRQRNRPRKSTISGRRVFFN